MAIEILSDEPKPLTLIEIANALKDIRVHARPGGNLQLYEAQHCPQRASRKAVNKTPAKSHGCNETTRQESHDHAMPKLVLALAVKQLVNLPSTVGCVELVVHDSLVDEVYLMQLSEVQVTADGLDEVRLGSTGVGIAKGCYDDGWKVDELGVSLEYERRGDELGFDAVRGGAKHH